MSSSSSLSPFFNLSSSEILGTSTDTSEGEFSSQDVFNRSISPVFDANGFSLAEREVVKVSSKRKREEAEPLRPIRNLRNWREGIF